MSENTDPALLAGQLAMKAGGFSAEHLAESLQEQDGRRIGDQLVERELIRRDEIERLIQQRDSSHVSLEETVLGELAVRNGFLSRQELAVCLAEQKNLVRAKTGTAPRLGEILTGRGLLQESDVQALLSRQASLLQGIVGEQGAAESDEDSGQSPAEANGRTPSAELGEHAEATSTHDAAASDPLESPPSDKDRRGGFLGLLFPEEAEIITCPSCDSSANSPVAIVCGVCGGPLGSRTGAHKYAPWGLRAGFVILAGVTGAFSLLAGPYVIAAQAGPYAIAAIMFIIVGATMLRNYRPSQRYFLISSVLLLSGIYVVTQVLGLTKEQIVQTAKNAIVWDATWGGVSLLLAALTLPLIRPLSAPILRGVGGVLLLLAVLLAAVWTAGGWLTGRTFPLWAGLTLGAVGLALVVLVIARTFMDGFRVKTRRPGVIMEATRPFAMPPQPKKRPRDLSDVPPLARPIHMALDRIVWSGRISGYYMLSSFIRFANAFAYWSQLAMDHVLRSFVRAWRRFVELTKILGKVIAGMVGFVVLAFYRILLVVVFPLVAIAASAVVAIALANIFLAYITSVSITSASLGNLASAALYAMMLYLLCVIVVGLLARCHSSSIVVKEAFQAFSYHLPNFLMLILGTSIVLSVFRGITGIGPYRFGFLSIVLTALVVGLFATILWKSKKKASPLPQEHDDEATNDPSVVSSQTTTNRPGADIEEGE